MTTAGAPSISPTPATSPSAGVRAISSSLSSAGAPGRRRSAARTRRSVPSSTRSARFSRAVRRPALVALGDRVRARASSRPSAWRSRTASRSARSPSGSRAPRRVGAPSRPASVAGSSDREQLALGSTVSPTATSTLPHDAAVLGDAPRAPSSSPRARSARCRRRPARRPDGRSRRRCRRTARPPELLAVRMAESFQRERRAPPPGSPRARRCRWRPVAMCDQATRPVGARSRSAPPSWPGGRSSGSESCRSSRWPSERPWRRPSGRAGRTTPPPSRRRPCSWPASRRPARSARSPGGGGSGPRGAASAVRSARALPPAGLELLTGAMQLHRVGLAIDSAVVA